MNHFALEASAFVKRCHEEPGSDVIQVLTETLLTDEPRRTLISWSVLAEALATLNRKKNAGIIPERIYQAVRIRLLLDARGINILAVADATIQDSLSLIEQHNLNASDALFLQQMLDWRAQLPEEDKVVVIAADHRLLRAAEATGLIALDPEQSDLAEVRLLLTTA